MTKICGKQHSWCSVCSPDIAQKRAEAVSKTWALKLHATITDTGEMPFPSYTNSTQRLAMMIRAGFVNACAECGIGPEWNGKSLTLQIDHIDGDSHNDKISNLRLLCPNCHTQTPTFGWNNARLKRKKSTIG